MNIFDDSHEKMAITFHQYLCVHLLKMKIHKKGA